MNLKRFQTRAVVEHVRDWPAQVKVQVCLKNHMHVEIEMVPAVVRT